MKKRTKRAWIWAIGFAVLGCVLCVGGVSMGAASQGKELVALAAEKAEQNGGSLLNVTFSHKEVWEETDWTAAEVTEMPVPKELEIIMDYNELILKEYDGSVVKIEYDEKTAENLEISGGEERLVIRDTDDRPNKDKKAVRISIPQGSHLEQLKISVGAGDVIGGDAVWADRCELDVGAGSLELEELNTKELTAKCGVGEIELELVGKKEDYSYSLSCGIGEIELDDTQYSGLDMEEQIDSPGAKRMITLKCGVGNIDVDFCE